MTFVADLRRRLNAVMTPFAALAAISLLNLAGAPFAFAVDIRFALE